MTDQFDNKAAELLPCLCLPAYKDRDLAQPDCPRCHYGDYVGDALREVDKAARAPMLALESLTPGGSEFVGDVERCVAHIKEQQRRQHELIVKFKKERDAARAEGYAAGVEEAAKAIEEPYQERWFSPLSEVELELASKTLQQTQTGLIDRLHAGWARHWAGLIRALLLASQEKE